MRRIPRRLTSSLLVLTIAALAGACAGTRDVDVTPTARMKLDAHVGKTWNSDSTRIENITDSFTTTETVYAVVDVTGEEAGTLRAKWMFDGDGSTVHEASMPIVGGTRNYAFRLSPGAGLRAGDYRLEVYVNDRLEDTERFKVGS
jgi:hypothetical protein